LQIVTDVAEEHAVFILTAVLSKASVYQAEGKKKAD
jgi:hypothetical protein